MHYYKKNIGDYAKKTGRLSMLAHGAYTLLIDACYDRERFPTRDEAIDWTCAESEQEVRAIDAVLRKFFTLEDGFYVQKRIKEEIDAYRQKSIKNKEIAINRETKRKEACTKRVRTKQVREPNQEPLTTISTITDVIVETTKKRATRLPDDWIAPDEYLDFCRQQRPDLDPHAMATKFKNYWTDLPDGPKARKVKWFGTWCNFVNSERAPPQQQMPRYQTQQDKAREWVNRMTGRQTHASIIDID